MLLLTIVLVIFGMLGTIVPVISGMSLSPLFLAVACHLAVFGIGLQFFTVILAATPALAFRFTANRLLRPVSGRLKRIVAIGTTAGLAQADSSDCEMRLVF